MTDENNNKDHKFFELLKKFNIKGIFFRKRNASEIYKEEIISKLNGTTLMVYFVLLNKNCIGVRDLQRNLSLSSPSVAKYHLDKICDLNLAENRNGIYYLIKKAELPILTNWILLGNNLYPKSLFAATFFTIIFINYIFFFYTYWNTDSLFVILISTLIMIYTWFDVFIQIKRKPF